MMLVHLVAGTAVVLTAMAAAVAYAIGRRRTQIATLAGWALGLLVVQAATGMFLLTATEKGPGPLHVALPLVGLTVAAIARFAGPDRSAARDGVLAAAFSVAALGAAFALATGLASG
jgi:hypothetical protein